MQAVAQDREAAMSLGIASAKLAPLALLLAVAWQARREASWLDLLYRADHGTTTLIKSLCIIILGEVGSIPGPHLEGYFRYYRELRQTFLGYSATTFPFLIILFILVFKRTGLMGEAA